MIPPFNRLSDTHKGTLLIITGTILLLHTLRIIEYGLDVVIIGISIYMIIIGLIKVRVHRMVLAKIQELRKPKEE